jgi:hypothetical protein
VCVFLGVVTRSTVAALLLTLFFWLGLWAVGTAERTLLMFKTMRQHGVDFAGAQVDVNNNTPKAQQPPNRPKSPPPERRPTEEAEAPKESAPLNIAHNIVYGVKTVLPKTTETIELLERSLVRVADLPQQQPSNSEARRMQVAQRELIDVLRGRSIAWILGTSLGFEAVVLAWAALVFCRRDY